MPKFLEERLRQQARKKGLKGEHADRYVFGAMNNQGAMHGSKITAKGREMERKHEAHMNSAKEAPTAAVPKAPSAGSHRLRTMRIERHHDKAGKVTGHTVHQEMEPVRSGKSGAFMEHHTESYPFGADQHDELMAHVEEHLDGK